MKKIAGVFIKSIIPVCILLVSIFFLFDCNLPTTTRASAPVAPAAPTLVPTPGQFSVTWTQVDRASAYEVWWNIANDTATATKYGPDNVLTVTVINGVSDGVTYWVWIKAKNRYGTSAFSPAASGATAPPTSAPASPAAPTVTPANTALGVSWTPVSGATAYEVWFNTVNNSGTATQFGGDISGASTTITGLTNGTLYYVWVLAKNIVGSSAFSPSSSGTPQIGAPAAPAAPTLTPGSTVIDVNWIAVGGATQYRVYSNTVNNSGTATQFGAPVAAPIVTITGLTNGTVYYVWVRAENIGGLSGFSPSATATPQIPAPAAPAIPTLTPGNTQIGVSWGAVATATQYRVYSNTVNNSGTATQFGAPVAGLSATITGLTNGTLYYVWVRAENAGGLSGFSPSASDTPITGPPAAPSPPTLTVVNDQRIDASWGAIGGATNYRVSYSLATNTDPTLATHRPATAGLSDSMTLLTPNTAYNVWLEVENAGGWSPYSATYSTATTVLTAPLPPTLAVISSTQIDTSWGATGGASNYRVSYSLATNTDPTLATHRPATAGLSDSLTGLSPSTAYNVWLEVQNAGGWSAYSATYSTDTTLGGVLPAPSPPTLTVVNDHRIDASWGAIGGATNYRVSYSLDTNTDPTLATHRPATAGLSDSITLLAPNTAYNVWLEVENVSGWSAYSATYSTATTVLAAPLPPTLTVISSTQIDASWGAIGGATNYRVSYSLDTNTDPTLATHRPATAGLSDSITLLSPSTAYNVWLEVQNAGGWSAYSVTYSTDTTPAGVLPAPSPPTLTAMSTSQIDASWGAIGGATNYRVSYSLDTNTDPTLATHLAATAGLSDSLTLLAPNTAYNVWLEVQNVSGWSAYSATYSTTSTLPPAPSPPTLTVINDQRIDASWGAIGGATNYRVSYSLDTNTDPTLATHRPATAGLADSITLLAPNTAYNVWLEVQNAGGWSAYSATYSTGTTVLAAPLPPTLTVISTSQIDASWGAIGGATNYRVSYSLDTNTDPTLATHLAATAGLSDSLTLLAPNTAYNVWLEVQNVSGWSAYSATYSTTSTLPPSPSPPTLTVVNDQRIDASWGAIGGATNYRVSYSLDTNTDPTLATHRPATAGLSDSITLLAPNTAYNMWLEVQNAGGWSAYSATYSTGTTALAAPLPPTLAVISSTQIDASWGAIGGATNYRVSYSLDTNTDPTLATHRPATAGLSDSLTGLSPSTAYNVWLEVQNAGGWSAYSATYSTDTTQVGVLPAPSPPTLTVVNDQRIDASWGAIGGATNYRVSYSLDTNTDPTLATHLAATAGLSDSITLLAPNTAYNVWLEVENIAGWSAYSATYSTGTTVLAAPSPPTLTVVNDQRIDASWGAIGGATNYRVSYSLDTNTDPTLATHRPATAGLADSITLLAPNTAYNVWLEVENAGGWSAYSATYSTATTLLAAPPAPTLTVMSTSQIDVSWGAIGGATNYRVSYSLDTNTDPTLATHRPATAGLSDSITLLTPNTAYNVWLEVENVSGWSAYSVTYSTTSTLLPAPLPPTLTVVNDQRIDASWGAIGGATNYRVSYSLDTNTDPTLATHRPATAGLADSITLLTPNTAYNVWLEVENAGGWSAYSATYSTATTLLAAPPAPTLTVMSTSQIDVSWGAIGGASNYRVSYSLDTNTDPTLATHRPATAGLADSITLLTPGTAYNVWLEVENASGWSAYSVLYSTAVTIPDAPLAPTVAANANVGELDVIWTGVTGATAYEVWYSLDTNTDPLLATQFGGDIAVTSTTITGLPSGVGHNVWVRAKNAGGTGAFSPYTPGTPL